MKSPKESNVNFLSFIFLWLLYFFVGSISWYIAHTYYNLTTIQEIGVCAAVFILMVVIVESLDKAFSWTGTYKAKEVLSPSEFVQQEENSSLGERSLVKLYIQQGGNEDELKAFLRSQ